MASAWTRTIVAVGALSLLAGAMAVQAQEAGEFAARHPRRAEVNRRVRRQNNRINQGVARGQLSPQEAQQLRANDGAIKAQEQADVRANGGYLTKGEKRQLNQEENANSQLIFDQKHAQ